MMRWVCCGVAVLVSLALLGALGPMPRASAGDGWWGALDEGEAVSLADVMAEPTRYRDRTLTFFCIFHAKESYFDPVRTPFNPKRHDNFSVWPDGAPIWEERAFQRDLPFLYIARNHPQRDALLALAMVTRIEVTGKVREVSQRGRPFIEVFSFRKTGHRLGRKVVRAINWGDNHARLGTKQGNQIAARSYRDALLPDLPPVYALVVRKRLAQALRRLGNEREARLVERGEILGGGSIPEPQPGEMPVDPMRGGFPEPATLPPPVTPPSDLPGTPSPVAKPSDLPGVPRGLGAPPRRPGRTRPATQPPPEVVPDMPVKPLTPESDLPGQPSGNPRAPDVLPPPRTGPRGFPSVEPTRPVAQPGPTPRPATGPGAPPTGPLPALPPPAVTPRGNPPAPTPPTAATPPPGAFPPALPEPAKAKPPVKKKRKPLLPGVPPKRKPRLSGVK